jgi:hypothetical protein
MASALLTDVKICKRVMQEIGEDPDAITDISSPTTPEEEACNLVFAALRDELQQEYQWNFTKKRVNIERNDNDRHTLLQADGGWTVSASGTNEYYLPISNPKSFKSKPDDVWEDDTAMTEGTLGSLAAGEWAFGDNDSLGESAIYVRLSDDTDPDSKFASDEDYLEALYDDPPFEWDNALPYPADTLSLWHLGGNSFNRQDWSISTGESLNITGPQEPTWEIEDYRLLYSETTAYLIYGHKVTDPANFDKWYTDAFVFFIASRVAIKLTNSRSIRDDMFSLFTAAINAARKNNALQGNVRREKTLTTRRPTTSWARKGRG